MRRPRSLRRLKPIVTVVVAPLLLLSTSCGSPRETIESTTSTSSQQLTAKALQQAVEAFSDRLVIRVSTTGDHLDQAMPTSKIKRRTLIWRLRTAQVAFKAQHRPNALVSLMQLWYFTAASNARSHSQEVQTLLGSHLSIVTDMSTDMQQQAETLAARSLPPDAFARVKEDIDKSSTSGALFSATSATDEAVFDQLLSASRLEKLIAIPLSPFDIFGGVNQGAEAITTLSITANRAVDLAEVYPQVIEWRLRLVALDLEELDAVQQVLANLNELTATARTLPTTLREQAQVLLEQSGPVQQETQRTLIDVRDAGTALQGAMASTQAAITSLDQFVARLTPPLSPPADPQAAPVEPTPPFRITDYTAALTALDSATKELHATLNDLQQPAFSGRVAELTTTAVDHAQRATSAAIDHLIWRIAQLLAFAALCTALLISLARWRRRPTA